MINSKFIDHFFDTSFLFTGDATKKTEAEMVSGGVNLNADVLKIGHHGSADSSIENFLDAVSPEYAVICVGSGNSYGHPTQAALGRLGDRGVKIYRTDINGTVVISSNGRELFVSE